MPYDKPFRSLDEQIALLKEKGLIIVNEDFAKSALSSISYYDLINRYQQYFMISKKFRFGVTIESLYSFYLFDKDIQFVIMKYSALVENIFKNKLSYIIAQHLGVSITDYLSPHYFVAKREKSKLTFSVVRKNIECYLTSTHVSNPTLHYMSNHNHIPPWILFKNISFSNSINIYKLLRSDLKKYVTDSLLPGNQKYSEKVEFLEKSLEMVRTFRNYAAHNLNFTSLYIKGRERPSPVLIKKELGGNLVKRVNKKIPAEERKSLSGVYGVILVLLILLGTDHFRSRLITDLLLTINGGDEENNQHLFKMYISITGIPIDFKRRLTNYYQTILVPGQYDKTCYFSRKNKKELPL